MKKRKKTETLVATYLFCSRKGQCGFFKFSFNLPLHKRVYIVTGSDKYSMSSCDGLYWYKRCVWSRSWPSGGISAFPTGNNRFHPSTEMLLPSDLAMKDWSRAEVCEKSPGQLQLRLLLQGNKLSLYNYIYPRGCTTLGLCSKYSISKAGPWGVRRGYPSREMQSCRSGCWVSPRWWFRTV